MSPRLLTFVVLAACADEDPVQSNFDGPESAAILLADSSPYDDEVAFVANTRSGRITPLDVRREIFLSDNPAAPFLRARGIATGDERLLGQIVALGTEDTVTLFAADVKNRVLVEAPYVLSADPFEVVAPSADDPLFVDLDGSGDEASLEDLTVKPGYTTTEDWSIEYDGEQWWVFGSRSGKQSVTAQTGEEYKTDNRELEFTIEGDATEGDRFEVHTDTGIVEHDLGGVILALAQVPGQSLLAAAVWNGASGSLVLWDPAASAPLGSVDLEDGAQPWRLAFDEAGTTLYAADARNPTVYALQLDLADFATSTVTQLVTEAPVSDLAMVEDATEGYRHLFVGLTGYNRVDVYDLDGETWLDVTPYDDVWGGIDLASPIVGLAASHDVVRLQDESAWGGRDEQKIVAATTADGSLVMFEGNTGCLAVGVAGPRIEYLSTGDYYDFSDSSPASNPSLYTDEATGQQVVVNECGGVARSETWTLTYDQTQAGWEVEGTRSDVMPTMATEDQRYTSDNGAISFTVLAGSLPSTSGDVLAFNVDDGLLRISEVPDATGSTDQLELPARPLVYSADVGPTGGGWDVLDRRAYVLLPVTNSDIVVKVRLSAWEIEAIWD